MYPEGRQPPAGTGTGRRGRRNDCVRFSERLRSFLQAGSVQDLFGRALAEALEEPFGLLLTRQV
jgi:hypothetical protein